MADDIEGLVRLRDQGRWDEAIASGTVLAVRMADNADLHLLLGTAHGALRHYEEALDHFRQAALLSPDSQEANAGCGDTLRMLGRPLEAIACYERALAAHPEGGAARRNLAGALNDAGAMLRRQGKAGDALPLYRRAVELDPRDAGFWYNLANALGDLGRHDHSLAAYDRCLAINPTFVDALLQKGNRLSLLHRRADAVACYEQGLRTAPAHAGLWCQLGLALAAQRRFGRAVSAYRRAIAIRPDYLAALYNLANLLVQMERRSEAIACFGRALEVQPDFAPARAKKLHQQALIGDWGSIAKEGEAIERLGIEGDVVTPFSMLAFEDAPARHRIRSERFVAKRHPAGPVATFARPDGAPERLRIGYFSADFCGHPTMHLMARTFELHDRSRFQTFAYAHGHNNDDDLRKRLANAFDSFRDVKHLGDDAVAAAARADGIDIAVDLTGHTSRNRVGILARRAAPIQINYLGYPGTMGAPFIDYIIADRQLIPTESRPHYSEKIIYLPDQYQAQDDTLTIAPDPVSRSDLGLPEHGFVFCATNNSYKIGPAEFAIWMRLLRQIDGSVLWLLRADRLFEANILRRTRDHGVEPDRIVFLDRVDIHRYLARLRLADLFLDTFNYNAGATTSHALWAGLPVLTRMGKGYTARMAGSLLAAIGLPELITTSEAQYEERAFALASQPGQLAAIRARLATNRTRAPLFDTPRFTRHLEAAYWHAYQHHLDGHAPADFEVPGCDEPTGRGHGTAAGALTADRTDRSRP